MRELPWRGEWIIVLQDGSVEWERCVVCRRPLKEPDSRRRGAGRVCQAENDDQVLDAMREAAKSSDRDRWRRGERSHAPLLPRIPRESERVQLRDVRRPSVGANLSEGVENPDVRWRVFQDAMRRGS